jgi:hypothetical protein
MSDNKESPSMCSPNGSLLKKVGATGFELPTKIPLMGLATGRVPPQVTAARHSENTDGFPGRL